MIPYIQIGPLSLGTFGLLMWVGFVAGYIVLQADLKRRKLAADPNTMVALLALTGLIGAKLWHVLESPDALLEAPIAMLFSRTGFAWYGGFLAGTVMFFYFARRYKIALPTLMDAAAPAAALGYAVGRIGCLLSGDGDYGRPTNLPWAMSFPNGLVPTAERVHPTPIYEFLACTLIFLFLWKLGGKASRPSGEVVARFFFLMGLERFLVEFIRINPPVIFGLSNAQLASLVAMAFGVVWLVRLKAEGFAPSASRR